MRRLSREGSGDTRQRWGLTTLFSTASRLRQTYSHTVINLPASHFPVEMPTMRPSRETPNVVERRGEGAADWRRVVGWILPQVDLHLGGGEKTVRRQGQAVGRQWKGRKRHGAVSGTSGMRSGTAVERQAKALPRGRRTQCGPGIGLPAMFAAACQRSRNSRG